MSSFALFTAGLAALAPLASAYTQPKGDTPSGNAIALPGLNDVVPAGKAYTITWDPTTEGSVSLLLCKGPSTNCVITATIADSIANTGTYSWTPSTDLEPSQPTGYGIELVVEGTGEYQYSTQFGISNPSYSGSSSSSSSSAATTSSAAKVFSSSSAAAIVDVSVNTKAKVVADSSSTSSAAALASAAASSLLSHASSATTTALSGTAVSAGTGSVRSGTGLPANFSGWGFANSTNIKATGSGYAAYASGTGVSSSSLSASIKTSVVSASRTASGSASASGSSTAAAASATHSGAAAGQFSASMGGLVVAAGIAVFAL